MAVDSKLLSALRTSLKRGDQTEIAKRLKCSLTLVGYKLKGIVPMTIEEAKVIVEVVKDRKKRDQKIARTLNPIINE